MKEQFVPLELAVKLKEKGFREKCLAYYDVDDNVGLLYNTEYADDSLPYQYIDLLASHNANEVSYTDDSENCVDAPTISQVLTWIREVHKIHIATGVTPRSSWRFVIMYCDKRGLEEPTITEKNFDSFEDAVIEGIKYVLDKMIEV